MSKTDSLTYTSPESVTSTSVQINRSGDNPMGILEFFAPHMDTTEPPATDTTEPPATDTNG